MALDTDPPDMPEGATDQVTSVGITSDYGTVNGCSPWGALVPRHRSHSNLSAVFDPGRTNIVYSLYPT